MNHSILVIDDETHFCSSLEVLLQAEGYRVQLAYSGQEALHLFASTSYSAVLIDIGLPDIDGIDVAAHVATNHPNTAAIILTGNATVDNAVDALRHGVYDYLRKPCSPDRLLRTIARGIAHKQLEIDLKNSEKRFRQLSQATWEGIIIYEEGRLLQANGQLCSLFGYTLEELLGRQIFDVLLDRNSIRTLHLQTDPDTIGPFEAKGMKKDGSTFPVEIRVKHIDYQGKQVQVAAIRDVTAAKIALKQKITLQEKLADAKRMESLGLMAGSVAHDLNNIMSGIITYPELLLMDLDEDFKFREEITMIRDAGKRAAAVVSDLLTVARGATSKKEVQNFNIIVSSYLNSVECREIKKRFQGISIDTYLEDKLLNVNCSAMHISKTLMNLVNNAAEAIQDQGQITVTTKNTTVRKRFLGYEAIEPGEYVVLAIEDNGPGISQQDIKQIFSPFYSKKVMGRSGTGLGLAVVWNTVHDHGGYIDLESNRQGTLFSLYFPADRNGVEKSGQPPALKQFHGKGEKILVVDDQKSQREIARRLLARLGYRPHTVKSGEEAVEFVKTEPVDLVMLDMLMDPGINGCETYQQILQVRPEQKAIIISGYSRVEEIELAKKMGIKHFVKKPYSLHELGQALRLEIS